MSTAARITTADELFRMPSDGYRYELVEGELKMMSPAGGEHGATISQLHWRLASHVNLPRLGLVFGAETGFLIGRDPDTVLAPDIAFVRQCRLDVIGLPKAFFPEAPALLAEVVSPSDTIDDVDEKMRRWLAAGVEQAWVVHPSGRTITVYRSLDDITVLTERDILTGDPVVPGFACRVGDIFVN